MDERRTYGQQILGHWWREAARAYWERQPLRMTTAELAEVKAILAAEPPEGPMPLELRPDGDWLYGVRIAVR